MRFKRKTSGRMVIVLSPMQSKRIQHRYIGSGKVYTLEKEIFRANYQRV